MNRHASCEDLRSHLAYLKLAAVAEQLPAALEQAERDKPGYTQFLHNLLQVEVDATEQRKLVDGNPANRIRPASLVNELATLRFVEETPTCC